MSHAPDPAAGSRALGRRLPCCLEQPFQSEEPLLEKLR
jgi:hypothetical protein